MSIRNQRRKREMTYTERLLAETYVVLKSLKELIKKQEDRIVDVYSITIPEDGGTQTLDIGTTKIDLKLGVITNPDDTIEKLERALDAYQPKELLHAISISSNKDIDFKIDNGSYYTIKANVAVQLPNVTYRSITIICTESTEISLFCSTNPGAVLLDRKTYTTPVGSQGEPFNQCTHNTLRVLDLYQYQVEHGEGRDTRVGYRTAIGSTSFAVLANADFNQPAGDMQMEMVSSDVGDDSVGAGAQLVRITYFNVAWVKKFTDVIMDGTTIVNTTATDIYRIDKIEVIKGHPAIGTITLKDTTGTDLYGQIEPLTTFMERAMAYVETGKRCVITDVLLGAGTNGGIVVRLFKSEKTDGTNIVTRGVESVELSNNTLPHPFILPHVLENPDGDRLAFGIAVKGIVANQRGGATVRFYCEDI